MIDVGWGGRVFFLLFTRLAYNTFRGKPIMQYSYWNDKGRRCFYEGDLTKPSWVDGGAVRC